MKTLRPTIRDGLVASIAAAVGIVVGGTLRGEPEIMIYPTPTDSAVEMPPDTTPDTTITGEPRT